MSNETYKRIKKDALPLMILIGSFSPWSISVQEWYDINHKLETYEKWTAPHIQDFECCFRKGANVCTFVKAFVFHRMNKLKPIIGLVHTKTSLFRIWILPEKTNLQASKEVGAHLDFLTNFWLNCHQFWWFFWWITKNSEWLSDENFT